MVNSQNDVLKILDNYYSNNNFNLGKENLRAIKNIINKIIIKVGNLFLIKKLFNYKNLFNKEYILLEFYLIKFVGRKMFEKYLFLVQQNHPNSCYICKTLSYFCNFLKKVLNVEISCNCEEGYVEFYIKEKNQILHFKFYLAIYSNLNYGLCCHKKEIGTQFSMIAIRNYCKINKALSGNLDRIYRMICLATSSESLFYLGWMHYMSSYITSLIANNNLFRKYNVKIFKHFFIKNEKVDTLLNSSISNKKINDLYLNIYKKYELKNLIEIYAKIFKNQRNLIKISLLGIKEFSVNSFHDLFYLYELLVIIFNTNRSSKIILGSKNNYLSNQFETSSVLIYNQKDNLNLSINFNYFKILQFYDFNEDFIRRIKKIIAYVNKTTNLNNELFADRFINEFIQLKI